MHCGFASYCYYTATGLLDEMSKYEVNQDANAALQIYEQTLAQILTLLRGYQACKDITKYKKERQKDHSDVSQVWTGTQKLTAF